MARWQARGGYSNCIWALFDSLTRWNELIASLVYLMYIVLENGNSWNILDIPTTSYTVRQVPSNQLQSLRALTFLSPPTSSLHARDQ